MSAQIINKSETEEELFKFKNAPIGVLVTSPSNNILMSIKKSGNTITYYDFSTGVSYDAPLDGPLGSMEVLLYKGTITIKNK